MKTLENRIPAMITELVSLSANLTSYEKYSCEYVEELSDVNYSVLKRAWRKADVDGSLSLSRFVNKLIKNKING